jgi:hypothetical protein
MTRLATGFAFVITALTPAFADDPAPRYPKACAAVDYCAPVERMMWYDGQPHAAAHALVASNGREAMIADPFPVLRSGDQLMHVCMRYSPFGQLVVTCLLLPSSD